MRHRNILFTASPTLVILLSLLSCSISRQGVTKRMPGAWQESPIVIDGSNKDWPSPYPEYDDKAMLGYTVSNDKENLYITAETGDPATMLKILREGLTVWIDKSGKKDKVMAINYPIPAGYNKNGQSKDTKSSGDAPLLAPGGIGQGQHQRMDMLDNVRKMLDQANSFSLQGFRSCNTQFQLLERDSCGIVVKMALDDMNELVWEAVVPFKAFYPKGVIDKRDQGRPMSVCFETVGAKRSAGQNNAGHRPGGGGVRPSIGIGGMGMGMRMGGGGAPTRNSQAAGNDMESLYKSTDTWKKFGLAFKE